MAPDRLNGETPQRRDCTPVSPQDQDGLSTDYLNHYSEIIMLIEMASFDDALVTELSGWQPIGYREYFLRSPLRRAGSALAAYDALPQEERSAFGQIMAALDTLACGAILALQRPYQTQNVVLVGEVIGPAMHRLMDRAAAFLSSGGCVIRDAGDAPQVMADRAMA